MIPCRLLPECQESQVGIDKLSLLQYSAQIVAVLHITAGNVNSNESFFDFPF